jgi:hypothetical protein
MAESKEIDPILEKKKNQLTDMLSQIDLKIKYISCISSEDVGISIKMQAKLKRISMRYSRRP